jgi:hypothetical protein
MNWKSFFDNWEEFFVGAMLQWFLYFIVGWWVLLVMALCSPLWRLGGWKYGNKLWRRIGVPAVVCGASIMAGVSWLIILAGPFMVWLAPSYGEKSWLFKLIKNDFITRVICYFWYWTAFLGVYSWVK